LLHNAILLPETRRVFSFREVVTHFKRQSNFNGLAMLLRPSSGFHEGWLDAEAGGEKSPENEEIHSLSSLPRAAIWFDAFNRGLILS
jgi:hypothetical protein